MSTVALLTLHADGSRHVLAAGDTPLNLTVGGGSGVPTRIRQGITYTVAIDTQINPIANMIIDGTLIIDGTVVF